MGYLQAFVHQDPDAHTQDAHARQLGVKVTGQNESWYNYDQ